MIYYWQDEIESIYTSGAYHNWTTPSDLYNSKYVGQTIGLQDLRFKALKDLLENRCRNVDKGKPIKPSGFRLFYADSDKSLIRVMHYHEPVFSVDSNNILTWEISRVGGYAQTTAMCQYNPVALYRLGTNNYSAVTLWDKVNGRKAYELPYVFYGLKYNLLTGKYLNAKPRLMTVEKPKERKEWRELLTKHKKVFKTTATLGSIKRIDSKHRWNISKYLNEVCRLSFTYGLPWYHLGFVEYVLGVMKSDTLPQEYINMLRYHCSSNYISSDNDITANDIESFFNTYGTAMKQYLGVYESIGHTNDKPKLDSNDKEYDINAVIDTFKNENFEKYNKEENDE